MKKLLPFLFAITLGQFAYAQCTLSGLGSFYCASDTNAYALTASCTGGSPQISGPGVSGGSFYPSQAGTGNVTISVLSGAVTYTVSQTGNFSPITMSSNATSVTLGDDAVSGACNVGFTFRFFGTNYTQFYISSNGFISFTSSVGSGCCSGQSLPNSTDPNNVIAVAWEDLYPPAGGTIKYETIGTAPNRICLITYDAIQHYTSGNAITTQIKLFENGCGTIEIHTTAMPSDGGQHTMGIENSNGTAAYTVSGRNASSWSITNDFVSFTPNCGNTFTTFVSGGPTLAVTNDTIDCFGDSTASISVSASGQNPFTYLWSNAETTATISGLVQGTYSVTVTDNDGCANDAEGFVDSPDIIGAAVNSTDALCESSQDGTASVYPFGGVPPYTLAWSNGGTGNTSNTLGVGNYTVTVTDTIGCQSIMGVNIGFDNPDPIVNLGEDRTICPGQQIVLVAPSGYSSYAWNDLSSGTSLVVSQTGTYSLTATSAAGCFGADTIEVTQVLPDQVELGPAIQQGLAPIVLDAGPQYTSYLWNTGATTSSIGVTIAGEYRVVVIDTNSCVSRDTVKVRIWPVGIDEISENGLSVYPNPTTDFLVISSSDVNATLEIMLFDMQGRKVMDTTKLLSAGEETRIDLGKLSPGNYLLKLSSADFTEDRLITVQ